MVKVRLTRKFANLIDGIDLSHRHAGDELDLSDRDARILILEGWATASDSPKRRATPTRPSAKKRHGRRKKPTR
jgi:hypothetical protein